jgi:hypothetical protein
MDIEADKVWVLSELKSVRDPHLIEAFKQLLIYRKSKLGLAISKIQFIPEIEGSADK